MLLSIIVPVYNVETYLRRCVDSLLHQDLGLEEYEIILIDDGSTDTSGIICDELSQLSTNILVLHKDNGGLSSARNAGIAIARGQYIQFVDSDDYLNVNVLGSLVKQLTMWDIDILRVNYQNVNEMGKVFEPNHSSKPFDDYSEEICDGLSFLNERLGYACYAVQFITKASILKQKGNGFKEGVYFEDVEWVPRIMLQARRVASSRLMVYNYLFRYNSITRNSDLEKKRKSVGDKIKLIESLTQQKNRVTDKRWFKGMIAQTALSVLVDVSCHFYHERYQFIRILRRLKVFPLSSYHATDSALKKIRLANLSPELLCFFLHLKNGR